VLRPGLTAIIIVAMLAWAGHSLARLFWLLNSPQTSVAAGPVVPAALPALRDDRQSGGIDMAFLQENFRLSNGGGSRAQDAGNTDSQQAASTRLSLVLRGSIAGTTSADSSAIIASGERQRVYAVGDELQFSTPGVTLDSVHPQYVVLNNNGRLESLWMYEPTGSATAPAARVRVTGSAAPQVNERVQIRLYRENGIVRGLQIRDDSDATLLAAAGLQVGDIITAVDGIAVNQGNDLSALTRELENRERVELALIRNGTPLSMTVSRDAFAF
tara:strand:- start:452 stop:1267 length:816 start_codon:yes stop_codon:yes gene_type:complete